MDNGYEAREMAEKYESIVVDWSCVALIDNNS
jgi:hypothetical protein